MIRLMGIIKVVLMSFLVFVVLPSPRLSNGIETVKFPSLRMGDLKTTLNLNDRVVRLLELAGCADVGSLATRELVDFYKQLSDVNRKAGIYKRMPASVEVEKWIEKARGFHEQYAVVENVEAVSPPPSGVASDDAVDAAGAEREMSASSDPGPVNFELDPDVVEMIALSPVALPLSGKVLAEAGVAVHDIPEAILLTAARGDVSMRVSARKREKSMESKVVKTAVGGGTHVNTILFGSRKEEVKTMRVRSTSEFVLPSAKPAVVNPTENEDRIRLLRSALPQTNEGVSPDSRRFVRGVLHSHPGRLWWGAVFTLSFQFFAPLGIFSALALLMKDVQNPYFQWVPGWFLFFPCSVFVFGILFLLVSYGASCRICGQRCFVPRQCLKNKKAHHIPVLGYVFATAMHMVLFSWFRCTYCGTPVRLKE